MAHAKWYTQETVGSYFCSFLRFFFWLVIPESGEHRLSFFFFDFIFFSHFFFGAEMPAKFSAYH